MKTRNERIRRRIFFAFAIMLFFSLAFTGLVVYGVINLFLVDSVRDIIADTYDITGRVRLVLLIPFSVMIALSMVISHFVSKRVAMGLAKLEDEKNQATGELKNVVLSTMAELIEERDDVTGHHIERTTLYLKALIDGMKTYGVYADTLSQYDESLLLQSCQLHDIGKVSIRDIVLLKPEKFTDDEYELIKAHTSLGEQVIDRIKSGAVDNAFLDYAKIFAAAHHEKWDGSGYPRGLKGEDIPLLGRMMAIADVYDALVSPRQYKKAFPASEAVAIILDGRGTHFDPMLTDLFGRISDKFEQVTQNFTDNDSA